MSEPTSQRFTWPQMQERYVGRTYRRRKDGVQETRWCVDVTLGGDLVYCYNRHRSWTKTAPQAEWLKWVAGAKDITMK